MNNNDQKKNKETRSMYIYTALIFVVAMILIIIAFFSQTNVYRLGKRAEEFATATPAVSNEKITEEAAKSDEYAKLSNMASELDLENKALKEKINTYDNLLEAYSYAELSNATEAQRALDLVLYSALTENQKVLYDKTAEKINGIKAQAANENE